MGGEHQEGNAALEVTRGRCGFVQMQGLAFCAARVAAHPSATAAAHGVNTLDGVIESSPRLNSMVDKWVRLASSQRIHALAPEAL
ncbi:hypothetical protein [Caenimonas soli]|uniref:hypothetical protein n=1 Tax=Caenimonas soli TaxID=2735555 RepID=UPI001A9ADF65|nr:hypothetical protein [Caenimonas soli]